MEIRRDSLCVRFTEYSRQCMRTLFWRMCHLSHCRIIARAPDARSRRHTRAGAARRSGPRAETTRLDDPRSFAC